MKIQSDDLKYFTVVVLWLLALQAQPVAAQALDDAPKWIIDNITCEGNATTKCDFITKKYYQQVGDVLDAEEIADAKLRLGTLIQFKTVNTRLQKGSQRGHVVVVFEVSEAEHIQYELGLGYHRTEVSMSNPFCRSDRFTDWCRSVYGDASGPMYTAAVTDFNFLGTGKRLSFGVTGILLHNSFDYNTFGTWYTIDVANGYTRGEAHEYNITDRNPPSSNPRTIALEYYDPHLLDSTDYFFRAKFYNRQNNGRNYRRYDRYVPDDQESPLGAIDRRESSAGPLHLELGRRFGSNSFVSMDVNSDYYSANYGWDSQDDSLFPTQGSLFSSTLRHQSNAQEKTAIYLNYKKHFAVSDNKILTFASNADYSPEQATFPNRNQWSANFSARYTNITAIDRLAGTYSGWFAELNYGVAKETNTAPGYYSYGFKAGYIYQTDSMIYRFTLGFNHQERN